MEATGQIDFSKSEVNTTKTSQEETVKELTRQNLQYQYKQHQLDQLASQSQSTLAKISTVFPFKVFPTHIIVDQTKISIVDNLFFKSRSVHSILIDEISDVSLSMSIFFATLEVVETAFKDEPIHIAFLNRNEAIKVRRIIQGLILTAKKQLPLPQLPPQELADKLETLGKTLEETSHES